MRTLRIEAAATGVTLSAAAFVSLLEGRWDTFHSAVIFAAFHILLFGLPMAAISAATGTWRLGPAVIGGFLVGALPLGLWEFPWAGGLSWIEWLWHVGLLGIGGTIAGATA